MTLKVEQTDYEKAVSWIRDLVSASVFTKERSDHPKLVRFSAYIIRLSVVVAKQLQELPFEKRDGNTIARAWANRLAYDVARSTSEACSLLSLLDFIPATAELLEKNPDIVIQRMEEARRYCQH